MINIAPNAYAFQSSLSKWSKGEDEANNAITGYAPDGYAFHTNLEENAWWVVDLKKVYAISLIKIFLRSNFEKRNQSMRIEISKNLIDWETIAPPPSPDRDKKILYL